MCTLRGRGGALLFALFAVAGCGGGVSGIGTRGDGGPGHPGDDSVGDAEIAPSEGGGSGIDPRCVEGDSIGTGLACRVTGLTCPLGTIADCNGGHRTLECLCEGQTWSCDQVTAIDCPPPATCPDPSTVYPGSPCGSPMDQQCVSTVIPSYGCGKQPSAPSKGTCTCATGGWSCPVPHVPCPPPAPPSCPDPYAVYSGDSCNVPGWNCAGNPQDCGGQVYYDALQCQGSYWVSVATTICEVYDGGGDAPALFTFDASPAEAGVVTGSE